MLLGHCANDFPVRTPGNGNVCSLCAGVEVGGRFVADWGRVLWVLKLNDVHKPTGQVFSVVLMGRLPALIDFFLLLLLKKITHSQVGENPDRMNGSGGIWFLCGTAMLTDL